MNYCPLNISTSYNFLSSALRISDVFKVAKDNGYSYFGVNDLNSMYAYSDIVEQSSHSNIRPIYGSSFNIIYEKGYSLNVSCYITSDEGYQNLCQIISLYRNGITPRELSNYKKGLIIVIPTISNKHFLQLIDEDKLESFSYELNELTNGYDDCYLGIEIYSENDKKYAQKIRDYASLHLYKLVAFNLHLYVNKQDAIALKILDAIKNDLKLEEKTSEGPYFFLKEKSLLKLYTEKEINNTQAIALSTQKFEFVKKRGKLLSFDIENKKEYIKSLCYEKLQSLNLDTPQYIDRLNYELDIIESMKYLDYFLIVKDYVDYAKSNKIPVGPGRGSAAGSLVSYLLNITEVDPLKYDLLFERFLNPKRSSMPDIDIDFADYQRDSIWSYIMHKYGNERTANIVTFQTFGPKAALRDIQKVFSINQNDINLLSSCVNRNSSFKETYKNNSQFRELCKDEYYLGIVKLAKLLEGLPRQQGMHAAGIIINNDDLSLSCPIIKNSDGTSITQFEGPLLNTLGFLKMDILGLTNLTIIEMMVNYIKAYYNPNFDIKSIPLDDKKTFNCLNRGLTCGLFQLESEGITKTLKNVNVDSFNDIVAVLALYRPGPMDNIPVYAERKNKHIKIEHLHPSLKEILEPTYGVIVYQEQIMQIVQSIAGFDLAQADLFRRAISKKDESKLIALKDDFLKGAKNNNIEDAVALNIFNLIFKFADYGFNKSHSVSYALITYQMAYIKANYPHAFYASMLNSLSLSDPRISQIKRELAYYNITLKLPSISKSKQLFIIEGDDLIVPISLIKGINKDAITIILEIQKYDISTFAKFVEQAYKFKLSEQMIISLINGGALDEYGLTRTTLRRYTSKYIAFYQNISSEGSLTNQELYDFMPIIREEEENEQLKYELESQTLGILLSGSILKPYEKIIEKLHLSKIENVINSKNSFKGKIVGIVSEIRKIQTKTKKTMAFIVIKDDLNRLNVTIFPETFEQVKLILKENTPLIIDGYSEIKQEVTFIARKIDLLEEQ